MKDTEKWILISGTIGAAWLSWQNDRADPGRCLEVIWNAQQDLLNGRYPGIKPKTTGPTGEKT